MELRACLMWLECHGLRQDGWRTAKRHPKNLISGKCLRSSHFQAMEKTGVLMGRDYIGDHLTPDTTCLISKHLLLGRQGTLSKYKLWSPCVSMNSDPSTKLWACVWPLQRTLSSEGQTSALDPSTDLSQQ